MPEPTDQQAASVFWREYAPPGYEGLLDAVEPQDDNTGEKVTAAIAFLWLADKMRYYSKRKGVILSSPVIRAVIDEIIKGSYAEIDALSAQLVKGAISADKWALEFQRIIVQANRAAAAAGRGGWAQLSQADITYIDKLIVDQLAFARKFLQDIKSGKQKLTGSFARRARMYGDAIRGTFQDVQTRLFTGGGATHARRILAPVDNCPDCLDWSFDNHGWWGINDIPRIGASVCRTNCHCEIEYGREVDGVIEVL